MALGDETISSVPLIALEQIDEGGIFQILKDTILLWFE